MALMQGNDNLFWTLLAFALMIASVVGTWYMVVVGRDRPRPQQRRGESTVARYGDIEEDRAPMPAFLTVTIAGSVLWAIVYAIWTGINGLGT
jgi:membrane protein DedA with SNARE-associated domain